MRSTLRYALLVVSLLALTLNAAARNAILPAGTLLQCTMNEPNFSSSTVAVGDPVLCHLRGVVSFGQQAFPRGSYLVGHLESAKDPGHFFGKGYLQVRFDRIGVPSGDLPLEAKVIATKGYKVDKEGRIDGKGHAKRDIAEWLLPPLWPWKVLMLPARGPRPKLKGESVLTLRLMDDVDIPQLAQTFGPGWHFFGHMQTQSYDAQADLRNDVQASLRFSNSRPQLTTREATPPAQMRYASTVSQDVSLPAGALSLPGMPVFVLTTGTTLSVSAYGYQDNRISYSLIGGGSGVISSDDVDWSATTRLNAQRGVRVTLHTGHTNQPGL
jgi:hypothetical protein